MDIKKAYDQWSEIYDTNQNRTRDLEGKILRQKLDTKHFNHVLEIGCGTGKNTIWLKNQAKKVTSVDFSSQMLAQAKEKINDSHVSFINADINKNWDWINDSVDLIVISLVLEHISDLDFIFSKCADLLSQNGIIYIGELHPFKQYSGSKARFESDEGTYVLECYTHHISEFYKSAEKYGLYVQSIDEHFDEVNKSGIPRILSLIIKK